MTFTREYRSHHQIIADENPAGMLATAMLDAAAYRARYDRELAEENAILAADARNPLGPPCIDPSAGDVRRSFYETMRMRGE